MGAQQRVATAAFALAALLAGIAFVPGFAAPKACPEPTERLARAGHSIAVGCAGGAPGRPLRGPARLLFGLRLDPNRADRASLEVLPAIGPVRAAAIEAERCRRPFRSVAELERVPGIGPRIAARLKPWLAVVKPEEAPCPVQ